MQVLPRLLFKALTAPYQPGLGREMNCLGKGSRVPADPAWTTLGGPPCSLLTWVKEGERDELPGQGVETQEYHAGPIYTAP